MMRVQCPECGAKMTAPSEAIGRKVKCRECSHRFVLSGGAVAESLDRGTANLEADKVEFQRVPESDPHLAGPELPEFSEYAMPAVPLGRENISMGASEMRYPFLHRYLRIGEIVAKVASALTFIWGCLFLTMGLFATGSGISASKGIFEGMGFFFTGVIILLIAVLEYILMMAGIQFVRVIIDIESNTRMLISTTQTRDRGRD